MTDNKSNEYVMIKSSELDETNLKLKEALAKNEEFNKALEGFKAKDANPKKEEIISKRAMYADLVSLKHNQQQTAQRESLEASYKARNDEKLARQKVINAAKSGDKL